VNVMSIQRKKRAVLLLFFSLFFAQCGNPNNERVQLNHCKSGVHHKARKFSVRHKIIEKNSLDGMFSVKE